MMSNTSILNNSTVIEFIVVYNLTEDTYNYMYMYSVNYDVVSKAYRERSDSRFSLQIGF